MQYWLVKEHQRNCEHPWLLPKPDCRVAISKHVKGMLYFLWQLKIVYLLVRMKLFFLSGTACNPNWTYIQSFAPCYITWWPGEGGGDDVIVFRWEKRKMHDCFFSLFQTIVTGAGDETLRFWNVFPSTKSQVVNNPEVSFDDILSSNPMIWNPNVNTFVASVCVQNSSRDIGSTCLGRSHIRWIQGAEQSCNGACG